MQKHEKRRELRLKKFWRSKTTSSDESTGCDSSSPTRGTRPQDSPSLSTAAYPTLFEPPTILEPDQLSHTAAPAKPTCSLPLLQVWPSQDSPRGEADGQSFIFISTGDELTDNNIRRHSQLSDPLQAGDSGIDSVQASPSPNAFACPPGMSLIRNNISPEQSPAGSPTPSGSKKSRRPSSALLHPDHARLFALRSQQQQQQQLLQQQQQQFFLPDQISIDDTTDFNGSIQVCTTSSSTTSSLTSVAGACIGNQQKRVSDPWLQPETEHDQRRRSSTMTARYSMFDALDLEYALLRAAARGSVGPYSLSESLHKLTFTQSLAFPALARGLATKRRRSVTENTTRPLNPNESGLNTFAKVVTAVVLVMVSFLVFLVVYKFVRT